MGDDDRPCTMKMKERDMSKEKGQKARIEGRMKAKDCSAFSEECHTEIRWAEEGHSNRREEGEMEKS